jgi:Bacterial SH3 domain
LYAILCADVCHALYLGALVPSKINPNDWDRLFAPNAPRRGGPLRTLINIILTVVLLALLSGGAVFLLNVRAERFAQAVATATSAAATALPLRTAAAQADLNATATVIAARAATAVAKPTPAPLTASVANGGNVREAPINGRPVDQVRAGEIVQLLEKNQDSSWFKVTYARNGQSITGWISRTLLTIAPEVEQQVP